MLDEIPTTAVRSQRKRGDTPRDLHEAAGISSNMPAVVARYQPFPKGNAVATVYAATHKEVNHDAHT